MTLLRLSFYLVYFEIKLFKWIFQLRTKLMHNQSRIVNTRPKRINFCINFKKEEIFKIKLICFKNEIFLYKIPLKKTSFYAKKIENFKIP